MYREEFLKYCINGDLDNVIKLTQNINRWGDPIDIHADNEKAFRLSCINGHKNVAD